MSDIFGSLRRGEVSSQLERRVGTGEDRRSVAARWDKRTGMRYGRKKPVTRPTRQSLQELEDEGEECSDAKSMRKNRYSKCTGDTVPTLVCITKRAAKVKGVSES